MNQQFKYKKRFWPFPFFIAIAGLILGGAVMYLWNAILPSLLGTNRISFWQSVGLLALCRILVGNFGGRMQAHKERWSQNWNEGAATEEAEEERQSGGPPWRNRWMRMTREERVKFRDEMRKRCGKPPEKQ